MEEIGERSFWSPPPDATPEQIAEFEAYAAKMLVPDEAITTWIDVSSVLDQRWAAIQEHVTQISADNPFVRFGRDAWADFWNREAYIRTESRIPAPDQETDLFAGVDAAAAGPVRLGRRVALAAHRRVRVRSRGPAAGSRGAQSAIVMREAECEAPGSRCVRHPRADRQSRA